MQASVDGELDVGEDLVVHVEDVTETADRVADHGDVLRAGGEAELEVGGGLRHLWSEPTGRNPELRGFAPRRAAFSVIGLPP